MGQIIRIDDLVDGQKFRGFNFNLLFWSFLAMFADGYDISVMPFAMPTLSKLWHVDAGHAGLGAHGQPDRRSGGLARCSAT